MTHLNKILHGDKFSQDGDASQKGYKYITFYTLTCHLMQKQQ